MLKRVALALSALLVATGAHLAHAQTCGGVLSCAATPAFTFADSVAGSVLNSTSTYVGASPAYGVTGAEKNSATGSAGVFGEDAGACTPSSLSLAAAGVLGGSVSSDGVIGYTNSTGIGAAGVAGYTYQSSTQCSSSTLVASGFLGYKSAAATSWGVYAAGNIGATGTKSFIEPHPTDASKEIRYVSLEGPEAGTYFRGTGHTTNGFATITVPDNFRMVTADAGLTVVVTATGQLAQIACISKSLDKIVIQASKDVAFDYVVNGVRKAFQDFQPVVQNDDFVPQGPNDNRFFTLPAESQRRLVATGIYLPDGSVNLQKAHEMGWDVLWEQNQVAQTAADGFLRFAALHH